jgi:phage shock protein PspC (stress-responsive transcriptional regulator)
MKERAMSMADELDKLHRLLQSGALTQAEYDAAKARLLGEGHSTRAPLAINRLRLSERDKWIAGVCGGIAEVTGVDSWIWRLIFVLGLLAGGFTAVLYIVLWIFVPREGQ